MLSNIDKNSSHIEASVRGDELSLIFCAPKKSPIDNYNYDDQVRRFAWYALQVAIKLKRRWLLVKENVKRIGNDQPPLDIAIGIHAGPVIVRKHARFKAGKITTQKPITAEGYAINIAKRVETVSRLGRFSRIFLTRPIYNRTPSDFRQAFIRVEVPQFKGFGILACPLFLLSSFPSLFLLLKLATKTRRHEGKIMRPFIEIQKLFL